MAFSEISAKGRPGQLRHAVRGGFPAEAIPVEKPVSHKRTRQTTLDEKHPWKRPTHAHRQQKGEKNLEKRKKRLKVPGGAWPVALST